MNKLNDEQLWAYFDQVTDLKTSKIHRRVDDVRSNDDDTCQYCFRANLTIYEGNLACESCGAINSGVIDEGQEWRFYGGSDNRGSDPTRCFLPTSEFYPESSSGSAISTDGKQSFEMMKVSKYNNVYSNMPYREHNLYTNLNHMVIYANNAGIANCIIEEAKLMFKKISDYRTSQGLNEFRKGTRYAVIAASILEASKLKRCPRTTAEVADIYKISRSDLKFGQKEFHKYWHLIKTKNGMCVALADGNKTSVPEDYLNRFCSKLKLGKDFNYVCHQICQRIAEHSIASSYIPVSITAGVIYLVSNLFNKNVSRKHISEVCDKISETTINQCYLELEKHLETILPQNIIDIIVKDIEIEKKNPL